MIYHGGKVTRFPIDLACQCISIRESQGTGCIIYADGFFIRLYLIAEFQFKHVFHSFNDFYILVGFGYFMIK